MTTPATNISTQNNKGRIFMEEVLNTCAVNKTTIWHRIGQLLGYGDCSQPNFENDPYNIGYAESQLETVVFVHLDVLDRIRLLLTGTLVVRTSTKTDTIIMKSYSKSETSVLPIGYRP